MSDGVMIEPYTVFSFTENLRFFAQHLIRLTHSIFYFYFILGPEGVETTYMPKLNKHECEELQKAAVVISNSIELGSSYVTGDKAKKPQRVPQQSPHCSKIVIDTSHKFPTIKELIPGKKCPSDQEEIRQ